MPRFQNVTLSQLNGFQPVIVCAVALLIISCIVPMGLSPNHNGEYLRFRNQYEMIAESFLKGQLSFQYEVDERLLAMENPYDWEERINQDVQYYWDHALYNGRYYMYFGVAPVFMLFLPFRIITGKPLMGYHGTQVFTVVYIIGFFMILWMLGKKFFQKMTFSMYMLLCTAMVCLSIWFAISAPALYSMAIVAGLACAIWSLYFFVKAVWFCKSENQSIYYAAIGSFLGALEFGCRPTIGLSNLVVCPLIVVFLQKHRVSAKLLFKMFLAALPYIVIASGLMIYNDLRFDNPFEFGQSYQLTVADQTQYGDMLSRFDFKGIIRNIYFYLFNNMFALPELGPLPQLGPFITFPVLPVAFALLFLRKTIKRLYQSELLFFVIFLLLSVGVVIIFDILWAPVLLPRYRMDFSWLLSIVAFILIGIRTQEMKHGKVFHIIVGMACILTLLACMLLFLYPTDGNFTEYYGIWLFG